MTTGDKKYTRPEKSQSNTWNILNSLSVLDLIKYVIKNKKGSLKLREKTKHRTVYLAVTWHHSTDEVPWLV